MAITRIGLSIIWLFNAKDNQLNWSKFFGTRSTPGIVKRATARTMVRSWQDKQTGTAMMGKNVLLSKPFDHMTTGSYIPVLAFKKWEEKFRWSDEEGFWLVLVCWWWRCIAELSMVAGLRYLKIVSLSLSHLCEKRNNLNLSTFIQSIQGVLICLYDWLYFAVGVSRISPAFPFLFWNGCTYIVSDPEYSLCEFHASNAMYTCFILWLSMHQA